jgi:hypothetical protein
LRPTRSRSRRGGACGTAPRRCRICICPNQSMEEQFLGALGLQRHPSSPPEDSLRWRQFPRRHGPGCNVEQYVSSTKVTGGEWRVLNGLPASHWIALEDTFPDVANPRPAKHNGSFGPCCKAEMTTQYSS